MKRRLGYDHKKTTESNVTLLSGDRVICRSTQYVSSSGQGKFETGPGGVKEYRVLSNKRGIVEVEELGTLKLHIAEL